MQDFKQFLLHGFFNENSKRRISKVGKHSLTFQSSIQISKHQATNNRLKHHVPKEINTDVYEVMEHFEIAKLLMQELSYQTKL